jgi:hypothetical protein
MVAAVATSFYVSDVGVRWAPVTFAMSAQPVELGGGAYTARITGRKVKDCAPASENPFIGWYHNGSVWIETPLSFPDDPSPNSSNPAGLERQSFGLFKWSELPQSAERVRTTVFHRCKNHLTVTTVGPFKIEPPEAN